MKIAELEVRIFCLETAMLELCQGLKYQIARIDNETNRLDANMHSLAAMAIRPPKDLLNGGSEPN